MAGEKLAVVIATCRTESFKRWFDAWKVDLGGVKVYVIEDQPKKSDDLRFLEVVKDWHHFAWDDIDADLGKDAWIIPRRTSAIKSYGFLRAYAGGADYIWTLDDDCFPDRGYEYPYVASVIRLLQRDQPDDSWFNTIANAGLYPRGYPYGIRQDRQPVMIHHGLWSGVPDLDGITALEHHKLRLKTKHETERVPTGRFFPMCGMNLAFRAEITPAMYFMLQGRMRNTEHSPVTDATRPLPFDRFDDIWAGLFVKKVCDHLGYAVTTGGPSIYHTKESDPTQRVIKEGPGIAIHELLWRHVEAADLTGCDSVRSCYVKLADDLDLFQPSGFEAYFGKLAEAMRTWAERFNE